MFLDLLEVVGVKVMGAVGDMRDIFPCIDEDLGRRGFAEIYLRVGAGESLSGHRRQRVGSSFF